jgi:hypothetical protein
MQKLELITLLQKNLEQKPKANNKQTTNFLLATYLHHIIDTKIGVAHHHTHRYTVAYITSNSNQYPLDWFKTHLMTTWGQIV